MTYPQSLATTCLLALALTVFACQAFAGELAFDLKGGVSVPIRTTPDGTYWQEAFQHKTRTLTGAWGAGLSYQATEAWSIQAHYLDLGFSSLKGFAVSDSAYDYKQHRCMASLAVCANPYYFKATDWLRGVDLTGTYTWRGTPLEPFVKGGVAVFKHHATFNSFSGSPDEFNGIVPELELGTGLRYRWMYLELDYFRAMQTPGQNLPISTQQVVGFVGVQIPMGG